jgi:hypothetical protein
MGTPPLLCGKELERINKRLRADGLDPDEVMAAWQKRHREGSTRVDYSTFADAQRTEQRRSRKPSPGSTQGTVREAIDAFRRGDRLPEALKGASVADLAAAGASEDEIAQIMERAA